MKLKCFVKQIKSGSIVSKVKRVRVIIKIQIIKMTSLMKKNCVIFAISKIKILCSFLVVINLAKNVYKSIHKIGKLIFFQIILL